MTSERFAGRDVTDQRGRRPTSIKRLPCAERAGIDACRHDRGIAQGNDANTATPMRIRNAGDNPSVIFFENDTSLSQGRLFAFLWNCRGLPRFARYFSISTYQSERKSLLNLHLKASFARFQRVVAFGQIIPLQKEEPRRGILAGAAALNTLRFSNHKQDS